MHQREFKRSDMDEGPKLTIFEVDEIVEASRLPEA